MTDETRQSPAETVSHTKPKPLTVAGRRALESAVKHGSPTHHLSGSYDWGGWGGTRAALQRAGYLDGACQITDAGRAAIGAEQLIKSHLPEGESA